MKNILKTLALSGCLLFVFVCADSLPAQTVPGAYTHEALGGPEGLNPGGPVRHTFERTSPAWKKQVKEVIFEGLPMVEVMAWLRMEFPEVNFVSADDVNDVLVKLQLRSVTLDDIFVALSITSKGEIVINPMNEKMVSIFYRPMVAKPQAPRKVTHAFSLASYLSGLSAEESAKALKDLEEALEISWLMLADANRDRNFESPTLNLHAPTKMLIAVGDQEQLQAIERFVSQLERRPIPAQVHRAPPGQPVAPVAPVAPTAPIRTPPTRTERLAPPNASTNQPPSNK